MHYIRRLYLYAVSFVSLEVVLWGLIGLARSALSGDEIGASASRLAGALSLILVGLPVFLLHWWLAQRSVAGDPEERSARLRAVFLYGVLLATLVPLAQNALALLNRFLLIAIQVSPQEALFGAEQGTNDNLIGILMNGLVAVYFFSVLRRDWQHSLTGDAFAEVRRLYRYLWLLYGLVLGVAGVQQLLLSLFAVSTGGGRAWQSFLGNGLTLALVGAVLWFYTERAIRRSLIEADESRSLLRLIVLYGLVFLTLAILLASTGLVLNEVMRALLGETIPLQGFLEQISRPVSIALPLVFAWYYYARSLRSEVSALPDSPRRNALRRLYYYVLAFLGLAAAFTGLQMLVFLLVGLAVGETTLWGTALRLRLASSLATLLVGLPLWVASWFPMVAEASQSGEAGDHARRSLIRKTYLYLVLFIALMGAMSTAGFLLFSLLKTLLGDPPEQLILEAFQLASSLILFAGLLLYHRNVLHNDGRSAERALAKRHALFPVLVLAPEDDNFAGKVVEALKRQTPALPVAIHPISQGVPDQTLSAARAVILPGELLSKPSEGLRVWLQNFSGTHLVVPTPVKDWHWVIGSGRSLTAMANQAARMVQNLADGEEIGQAQESSAWMIVVYIMAGLFTLQVGFILVSLLVSYIFP